MLCEHIAQLDLSSIHVSETKIFSDQRATGQGLALRRDPIEVPLQFDFFSEESRSRFCLIVAFSVEAFTRSGQLNPRLNTSLSHTCLLRKNPPVRWAHGGTRSDVRLPWKSELQAEMF